MRRTIIALTIVCLTASCAAYRHERAADPSLGSKLTKLTAAVEAFVRYQRPASDMPEPELLKNAVAHDPTLLATLSGDYRIRVLRLPEDAVVLVCTLDGAHGLAMDAGCTAPLEEYWALHGQDIACEFPESAASACAKTSPPTAQ